MSDQKINSENSEDRQVSLQSPFTSIVSQVVEKIKNEPFLFAIAIIALVIALVITPSGLGSSDLRFVISIITALAFIVILGYFLQAGYKEYNRMQRERWKFERERPQADGTQAIHKKDDPDQPTGPFERTPTESKDDKSSQKPKYQFDNRNWKVDQVFQGDSEVTISDQSTKINTGGGTYVGGSVNTGGGDFTGRDQKITTTTTQGGTLKQFTDLLGELHAGVASAELDEKIQNSIESEIASTELEANAPQPRLPVIESRLKGIQSLLQRAAGTGAAVIGLAEIVQRGLEMAQQLFR